MIMRTQILLDKSFFFYYFMKLQDMKSRSMPVRSLLWSRRGPVDKQAAIIIHMFSSSPSQGSQQVHIVLADTSLGLAQLFDSTTGMQHGRVIPAAEGITDLRQAVIGQFLR
jgi:hypothetical protein